MRSFAAAFVLGMLALQQAAALPEPCCALAGLAALLAMRLPFARSGFVRCALLVAAGASIAVGYGSWRAAERLAQSLPRAWEGRDIEVTGLVASLPQVTPAGTRFLLDVERVHTPGTTLPETLALSWYGERGAEESAAPPPLVAGERWRLTVRLKRPRGLANPHGFDFEPWALERDIRAAGYVRAKPAPTFENRIEGWPYTLHRWRGEIRAAMLERLGEARMRGVLVALAIGDQDSIASADWEVFWRTGVGHLMSISGLHITMIGALGFAVAYFLWVRVPWLALRLPARKAAVIAGAFAALAYTLMTGYAVPAQRTFFMLATVAACVLADRHGSASRVLAAAALVVVAIDPWAVLSAGFWLSFGAVAAIFYVMAFRAGRQAKWRGAVLEQLAVTVVMLPMLLALFQEISLVSPLANAFAIPLVSLVVVPLTLAGAFLPLAWLLDLAHAVMLGVMMPLEWLASLPAAMLESHAPPAWTVALGAVGCLWLLAPRGVPMRSSGAVWVAPMFAFVPPSPEPGAAWIDVLDVGNGLAVVVRTASHALVYDTGPAWSADSDTGSRIVVPFLRGEGVRHLDGLVISHADDDHAGGAQSVARARHPEWLLSPLRQDHALHQMVPRSIRCEAGDRWTWDGVEFRVLHPAAAIYDETPGRGKPRKENDRGCVVRIAARGASALLAADVEARSEAEMLSRDRESLRSDVLLIAHHGSRTSSTAPFVDAVHPAVGLLSVGYRNRFRHPHEAVVARYLERRVDLHRTDREGALHVVLPAAPGPAMVRGFAARCRYWSERDCDPEG